VQQNGDIVAMTGDGVNGEYCYLVVYRVRGIWPSHTRELSADMSNVRRLDRFKGR
jgi:hypothetical protein